MSPAEPHATRDKERTKQAIIAAATRMISAHGAGVSLADIAAEAGVSKGALTHHFPSRDALEVAILASGVQRFRDEVHARVDLAENRPGKLLRGYIRALTTDSPFMREVFSPAALLLIMGAGQPVQQLLEEDAQSWRQDFAADGLDPATSLVLRYAAEGLAGGTGSPYLTPGELESARARLLELAEPS